MAPGKGREVMDNKERLEKFESYLNEFEHACRGGDYEASEHLKNLIIQTIEQQQQEIEKWKHMYETDFESYERLRDAIEQAQTKIERYEKALREIANEQEVGEGDFNADDVANNLIATAKQALEGDAQ
jgi:septal ring factor EnvC (AmiA/AmiB activator)